MALPELIEILPLESPIQSQVRIPGSKSITNRALILAALADRETILKDALWSEDTQVMVEALRQLGVDIQVTEDPEENANRYIKVKGRGGELNSGGTLENPLELYVGNAGTAARFLTAVVCLGQGVYRLSGVSRMHERPQAELFRTLRELGYLIDSDNDRLPLRVHGGGKKKAECQVSMDHSSQFASALILAGRQGDWTINVQGESEENAPYVAMTRNLVNAFRKPEREFQVEPDASSASYFQAVGWLLNHQENLPPCQVAIFNPPQSTLQIDSQFHKFLPLPEIVSRRTDLGDSILTAMIVAPFGNQVTRFEDLGRLRLQECERVVAMKTELEKCGATIREIGDVLEISPSKLHGAEIQTYQDHRIAMCFSILGLMIPGIKIRNPACVGKTFPNFYRKLTDSPPQGLGARIRNPHNDTDLDLSELS
ncbi:MAG TPA: 3-phosphoshikimate 1-carboxyvinyltransferase [Verrucomicrobiales bacterium]|nr:3-phosphoshikimate 1-carboxyvinyltransferase [Verrucomicrobiales bacterium]